jgi:O-antigen ligase
MLPSSQAMKNPLSINDSLPNKISFYLLVLFPALLPFDQFYSELALASFFIHTLIHARKNDYRRLFRKEVLLLISVFLLTAVFTLSSDNQQEAWRLWMRQLAILFLPISLFLNPIPLWQYARSIFVIFGIVCTAAVLYLYYDALSVIRYFHLPFSSLFSSHFMNHQFADPLEIHATYLSLYVFLSLVAFIHYYFLEQNKPRKALFAVGSFILLAGLIQLGSRAIMIAFLLVSCLIIPFWLNKKKRAYYFRLFILAFSVFILTLIFFKSFQDRFLYTLQQDLTGESAGLKTTDSRMQRWIVAYDVVKDSPFVGHGTGDEVDLLREQYFKHHLFDAYLNRLNAHNQYISFLLMGGFVALSVYLYLLLFGLRLSIRSKNFLFLGFIVLLLVVSFSENYLLRNKGIFFYSFFFSLFVRIETMTQREPVQTTRKRATLKTHFTFLLLSILLFFVYKN